MKTRRWSVPTAQAIRVGDRRTIADVVKQHPTSVSHWGLDRDNPFNQAAIWIRDLASHDHEAAYALVSALLEEVEAGSLAGATPAQLHARLAALHERECMLDGEEDRAATFRDADYTAVLRKYIATSLEICALRDRLGAAGWKKLGH